MLEIEVDIDVPDGNQFKIGPYKVDRWDYRKCVELRPDGGTAIVYREKWSIPVLDLTEWAIVDEVKATTHKRGYAVARWEAADAALKRLRDAIPQELRRRAHGGMYL